jgi:hypothetical protein
LKVIIAGGIFNESLPIYITCKPKNKKRRLAIVMYSANFPPPTPSHKTLMMSDKYLHPGYYYRQGYQPVAHCAIGYDTAALKTMIAHLEPDQQEKIRAENGKYAKYKKRVHTSEIDALIKSDVAYNIAKKGVHHETENAKKAVGEARMRHAQGYDEANRDLSDKEVMLMEEETKSGFINMLFIHSIARCWGYGEEGTKNMIKDANFFYIKTTIIFCTFTVYLTCLIMILACNTSINACKNGISNRQNLKKKDGVTLLDNCSLITTECKFDWLVQDMNIESYIQGRLFSYVVSTFPLVFMAYASRRHLKNVINEFKNKAQLKDMLNSDENAAMFCCRSLTEKGGMEFFVFLMVFFLHFTMGAMFLSMDIQIITFFSSTSLQNKKCQATFGEESTWNNFIATINPQQLAILLLVFNLFGMIWATIFVLSHLITYASSSQTKKLKKRIETRKSHMAELSAQSHPHPHTVNNAFPMPQYASAQQSPHYVFGHPVPLYDTSSMGNVGQSHVHGASLYTTTQVNR